VKEKSVIIMTIRMEMAVWRSSAGFVNLVTATRGDTPFSMSLLLRPPTTQQTQSNPK
jgi:hypothetical protein